VSIASSRLGHLSSAGEDDGPIVIGPGRDEGYGGPKDVADDRVRRQRFGANDRHFKPCIRNAFCEIIAVQPHVIRLAEGRRAVCGGCDRRVVNRRCEAVSLRNGQNRDCRRAENATDVGERAAVLSYVLEDVASEEHVERLVGKRQARRISAHVGGCRVVSGHVRSHGWPDPSGQAVFRREMQDATAGKRDAVGQVWPTGDERFD